MLKICSGLICHLEQGIDTFATYSLMSVKQTAILISNKYPFPCDDGKKAVITGFLEYLVERYGHGNVYYIVVSGELSVEAGLPGVEFAWVKPPGLLAQVYGFAKSLFGASEKSFQEALTYSPRVKAELRRLVRERDAAILILDTLRTGQYFEDVLPGGIPRILYMDDLFYLRYKKILDAVKEHKITIDPAGTFASFLPAVAKRLLRIGGLQSLLFKMEMKKIERREVASISVFEKCLLINENEAQVLKKRIPGGEVGTIKPLLFRQSCKMARNYAGAPLYLMFGSLRHPVYRASVTHFLETCMDDIVRQMPDAKIRLVGGGADRNLQQLADHYHHNIEICGFIQNIDSVFSESCALLLPLLAAGGLKIKAITALYYGLPVISTDNGVNGLPLKSDTDYIGENRIENFPMHMAELRDTQLNEKISVNASHAFRKNFSREQIFVEYRKIFG